VRELYQRPTIPAAYQDRMQHLFDTAWNETALLAEIDRMEAIVTAYEGDVSAYTNPIRDFVSNRRAKFAADFAGGPPVVAPSGLGGRPCFDGPSFSDIAPCPTCEFTS
jgi:hypothetical protein